MVASRIVRQGLSAIQREMLGIERTTDLKLSCGELGDAAIAFNEMAE
jgi:hypothetical protein